MVLKREKDPPVFWAHPGYRWSHNSPSLWPPDRSTLSAQSERLLALPQSTGVSLHHTDSSRGAAKVSMRVSNTSVPYDLTTEREGRKEGRKERRKKITERVSSLRRAQNTSNPVSSDFCKRLVEVLPSTSFRFLPFQKHLQWGPAPRTMNTRRKQEEMHFNLSVNYPATHPSVKKPKRTHNNFLIWFGAI